MTIDTQLVLNHFTQLTGLDQEEAQGWIPLCRGAADWVAGQLRRGVCMEQHQPALALAAAGLAYYQFALAAGGQPALKIGDLQMGAETGSIRQAAALRDQLLTQAAHCLRPQLPPALTGVQP